MAIFNSYVKLPEGTYHYLLVLFFARLSENLRQWIQKPLQGGTRQLRAEEWKYIYILLFLSIHILLVAWTVDQHIPASRFWNAQCSELLPCICCFIGNAHTQMDAADLHGHGSNCFTRPTPWSCIFRIFCFGFVAPTIFSHITCNSKGTSTLLIRTSAGRTKWKVVRYSWINSTFWTLDISGSLVFRHCLDMIRSGEAYTSWTPKGLHVCWVCWNSTCVLLQSRFGSLFHGLAMPLSTFPSFPGTAARSERMWTLSVNIVPKSFPVSLTLGQKSAELVWIGASESAREHV